MAELENRSKCTFETTLKKACSYYALPDNVYCNVHYKKIQQEEAIEAKCLAENLKRCTHTRCPRFLPADSPNKLCDECQIKNRNSVAKHNEKEKANKPVVEKPKIEFEYDPDKESRKCTVCGRDFNLFDTRKGQPSLKCPYHYELGLKTEARRGPRNRDYKTELQNNPERRERKRVYLEGYNQRRRDEKEEE